MLRGNQAGITPQCVINASASAAQPVCGYVKPASVATETKTYSRGRYIIRTHWEGAAFVYDVLRSGTLLASGFDLLSGGEEAALQKITERFYS